MLNQKILIVDDDVNICQLLNLYLVKEGYTTFICHNGKDAIKQIIEQTYDIVLLDIMMPEMDGFETLSNIRKFSNIPVILLSAKGEPMDKISGLDIGADDYVTKPFEPQELISRIKALLRRTQSSPAIQPNSDLTIGNLYVSLTNYIVKVNDKKVDMPPKEIELVYHLASNPVRVYTREQLLAQVWGVSYKGDTRTVDVHIKRIREKLGQGVGWRLDTVWGVGYKFELF
ncbi:MAG: response regulator transcription factor [Clostridiales bacterium]|jgi:DNA-binding response OmpR family regulator|nr:response regulator transcription factor [Clostridiales bacterium]